MSNAKKTVRAPRGKVEQTELSAYLESLGLEVKPTIHVNGHNFSNAIAVVDFGTPLKPIKLTSEQVHGVIDGLRKLARATIGRDANVRVSHDASSGIYWASIG